MGKTKQSFMTTRIDKYYYTQGIGLLNEKKKHIKQERWCKHVYLVKNYIWIFCGRSTVNKITWNFIGFGYQFKKGLDNIKQFEFRFNPREIIYEQQSK